MPRTTKIVATLGPASSDPETLEKLVVAGIETPAAMIAYPTAAMRWSGASICEPFTPSLNQIRRRTSALGVSPESERRKLVGAVVVKV